MISRKRIYIKYIVVIIFVLGFTSFLFGVKIIQNRWNVIPNFEFSDEQIKEYGEFWLTIPAAENKGLQADINAVTFEDEPDSIYFVLPSTMDISRVVYYVRDGYESNYEARRIADFCDGDVELAGKKIKLVVSNIPVMFIETGNNSIKFDDFVDSNDRNIECYLRMCLTSKNENGHPTFFETEKKNDNNFYDKAYIKPRGNSTWSGMYKFKKPYTLVLEKSENLLNMGSFSKWNLLADSQDKSLLKNYMFNYLSHEMGVDYEPYMEHILLYINGSIQGVYLLTTKMSVGKNKIELADDDFLFIWSGSHPEQIIPYKTNTWFCDTKEYNIDYPYVELVYPKNDTDDGLTEKQNVIQNYVSAMENKTSREYMNYIDIDSIVKFYWIQEISMNIDACYRSVYTYYRHNTGKLYFGPVWDMDLTLGTNVSKDGVNFSDSDGWKTRKIGYYKALFSHHEFVDAIDNAYWNEKIREKMFNLSDEYIEEMNRIYELGIIDNKLWKHENLEIATYYDDVNYDVNAKKTLEFYINRINWIDEEMKKGKINE